jgi:hypothetical protein
MKYVKKHLNFCLFIYLFLSAILGNIIVNILHYLNLFQNYYKDYPPISWLWAPLYPSFAFDITLIITNIFSMIGFAWFLRIKNHSQMYLLLFASFYLFIIPVIIYYLTHIEFNTQIIFITRFVGIIVWISGVILLFLLKNESTEVQDTQDKT